MTPLARRLHRALLFALALAALVRFLRPVDYIDVWWHLAAGESVWRLRTVPRIDPFSWTVRGRPWLDAEWLYEVVLYVLDSRFGLSGIIALKAALGFGILAMTWRRLRQFSKEWVWPLLAIAVIAAGAEGLWHDRSELVSIFLLASLLAEIDWSDLRRRAPPSLWAWPFVFAVWANTHGFFVVGLAVAGFWSADFLRSGAAPFPPRTYALWFAACAAATLANPYGAGLHAAILRWTLAVGHAPIYEMRATPSGAVVFWAALALAWLSFAARWSAERRIGVVDALVCGAFTWLGVRHARGTSTFLVLAFPYALKNLAPTPLFASASAWIRRRQAPLLAGALAAVAAWIVVASGQVHGGVDEAASLYAAAAGDFIAAEGIRGPVYNDYGLGSYLVWRFKGDPGVFVDGRLGTVDGYDEVMGRMLAARSSPEVWNGFLSRAHASAALVRYPFASTSIETPMFGRFFPRDRWALVYWDDLCLLFLRRTPENRDVIARREFKFIQPDATEAYLAEYIRGASFAERAAIAADARRGLALHPGSARARAVLALLGDG